MRISTSTALYELFMFLIIEITANVVSIGASIDAMVKIGYVIEYVRIIVGFLCHQLRNVCFGDETTPKVLSVSSRIKYLIVAIKRRR